MKKVLNVQEVFKIAAARAVVDAATKYSYLCFTGKSPTIQAKQHECVGMRLASSYKVENLKPKEHFEFQPNGTPAGLSSLNSWS